jgi:hypothetical protein
MVADGIPIDTSSKTLPSIEGHCLDYQKILFRAPVFAQQALAALLQGVVPSLVALCWCSQPAEIFADFRPIDSTTLPLAIVERHCFNQSVRVQRVETVGVRLPSILVIVP